MNLEKHMLNSWYVQVLRELWFYVTCTEEPWKIIFFFVRILCWVEWNKIRYGSLLESTCANGFLEGFTVGNPWQESPLVYISLRAESAHFTQAVSQHWSNGIQELNEKKKIQRIWQSLDLKKKTAILLENAEFSGWAASILRRQVRKRKDSATAPGTWSACCMQGLQKRRQKSLSMTSGKIFTQAG